MLAYEVGSNDGFLKTFTIPSTGNSITKVISVEHDNAYGKHNSLVQIDSGNYVFAYESSDDVHVILTIHNLMGREVIKLVDGPKTAGSISIQWNARDGQGRYVSAGLYLYTIQAG